MKFDTIRRENLFRNPPTDHTAYPALTAAVAPHIESFNALFEKDGLIAQGLLDIGSKTYLDGDDRGKMSARMEYSINNGDPKEFIRDLGQLPLMLMSNKCHLQNNSPAQLVQKKEESEELGGYFVAEVQHTPSLVCSSDPYDRIKTSQTNVLHYLNDGNVTFPFLVAQNEFLVPAMMILKALVETNDKEIFEGLVGAAGSKGAENTFLTDRVELLLRTYKAYGLYTKSKTRAYLGEKFRIVLGVPDNHVEL
ncbi:hypothetical protein DID88_000356 [Monilinia fructigena]|uniref:DNA-directed RNA polymerase n=1 Tax=Monilinia fructigena TaxID=38457 RepID=A0A395IIK8_9HELO|nr:hypothetical protein DID88_000356 [Monilinia fructigena]